MTSDSTKKKAKKIRLVLFDCDGVLTDGGLYITPEGDEIRRFHVHDGYGIRMLKEAGIKVGLVTGKGGPVIRARVDYLKFDFVREKCSDKRKVVEEILQEAGVSPEEAAFVGDDVFDIPGMEAVGLSIAVSNARPEVKEFVDHVTKTPGGEGAAREIAEMILSAQGGMPTVHKLEG